MGTWEPDDIVIEVEDEIIDSIEDEGTFYHPCRYKKRVDEYNIMLSINGCEKCDIKYKLVHSVEGRDEPCIDVLSRSLGSPSKNDLYEAGFFCDIEGNECYYTWEPIHYCQDIIAKDGNRLLTLWYEVLITDEIEEYTVGLKEDYELSILQCALDHKETDLCLVPSKNCIELWGREETDRRFEILTELERTKEAFLWIIDGNREVDLFEIYKILPKLPIGDTLVKLCLNWLEHDRYWHNLDLALWLFESRSRQMYKKISVISEYSKDQIDRAFAALIKNGEEPYKQSTWWPNPATHRIRKSKEEVLNEFNWFDGGN